MAKHHTGYLLRPVPDVRAVTTAAERIQQQARLPFDLDGAGLAILAVALVTMVLPTAGRKFLAGLPARFLVLAAALKTAAFPLHGWLTDAYPEATPTGTVFLSAFTTKVAIYALARGFPGTELLVLIGAVMVRLVPLFRAMQLKIDRINLVLRENLTGIRVIRAFVRTAHEEARFSEANADLTDTTLRDAHQSLWSARMLTEDQVKITFSDVAGVEEAKEEVKELVDFLKDPSKFQKLGGKIPSGVLMVGPPGTGKTLLARTIAGEAKVPFFTISGSDFVEMFVGVGASRVRDMFEQAKKNAPCIVFIDEIDAVGRHRGAGYGGGNDEREQTLNQLLAEMDGFEPNQGVIIMAATNRPEILDRALLRPGRFDRQVVVPLPDVRGREQILKVHMKKVPLGDDVRPAVIARGTPGFSGADLANLVNEAALLAARRNKRLVAMQEFEDAKDKVMMGAERRSMVMTEDEKKLTAFHEAGHAVMAY